ncbi:MAG TPA: NUMOD4 motif-containing HNH endonuclease [Terriglobia bacterium]|nr:NUMOD4 motif-containing HNH endonuclease [Terriglobia bacterium]
MPETDSTIEIWKEIPGYEGRYQASNLGRIRNQKTHRVLRPTISGKGKYLHLNLGQSNTQCVHILVAVTFLGPVPEGKEVNHKDGVKTNCCSKNLEYLTCGDNHKHAYLLGLKVGHSEGKKGDQHWNARLTEGQVKEIRSLAGTMTHEKISLRFSVCRQTVTDIIRKKRWKHC